MESAPRQAQTLQAGSALKTKKYDSWRYTGVLTGAPDLTDELCTFFKGKSNELSEEAQLAFLHYGHSWYAPPSELLRYHIARFGPTSTFKAICHFDKYYFESAFETWLAQGAPGASNWTMRSLGCLLVTMPCAD